jgi:(R,R)-butanediol dehydrogenase / meso-butanediol dehydrogenase / diacetyl reductase
VKAAIIDEQHHLDIVDVPDPTPGPRELVLDVRACGICGSDLKLVDALPPGLVMGHEFCGVVAAAGTDVSADWREGQLVAGLPLTSCGRCRWCLGGEPTHCETVDRVGVGGSAGAFAQYVRVDVSQAVALDDEIGERGALVEPLAVGLHTVAAAEIEPADRVLVIGAGPVGLAVITWARRFGAGDIVVSDPSAGRREAAPTFGATATVDPGREELGTGFDVVFECVGAPGLIASAAGAIRPRGRIIVAGVCLQPDPLPPGTALMNETTVRWVMYYTRGEFELAARLLERGDIDGNAFVTGHTPLEGIDDAFRELKSQSAHRKLLVVP